VLKNTKTPRSNLNLETLEDRFALSVASATLANGTLTIYGDNNESSVRVYESWYMYQGGPNIVVKDYVNGFTRSFASSSVQRLQFVGGAGLDRIVNEVSWLPLQAWGNGGNDYLEGGNASDILEGGDGNDTLVGKGMHDQLYGGYGTDRLSGGEGTDILDGGVGDWCADSLHGGPGMDWFRYDQAPVYSWSNYGYWYISGYYNRDSPVDLNLYEYDTVYS